MFVYTSFLPPLASCLLSDRPFFWPLIAKCYNKTNILKLCQYVHITVDSVSFKTLDK
jgi:hypothetical protein